MLKLKGQWWQYFVPVLNVGVAEVLSLQFLDDKKPMATCPKCQTFNHPLVISRRQPPRVTPLEGHSVYFNTAVTSPEIFWKLRFLTKKRARSISYDHIKMMQSMVYLISLYTLFLIKWHVTSPEILTTWNKEWMNIK